MPLPMMHASQLDNPFHLARAIEPMGRAYMSKIQALPGNNRGFRFLGLRGESELAGKSRFEAVAALDAADPLRSPLLRWIHRLTEMRINQPWLDEDQRLLREVQHVVSEPKETRLPLAEMKALAFSKSGEEARLWWNNIETCGRALSAHRVGYFYRCAEIHTRLGQQDVLAYFSASTESTRATHLLEPTWRRQRELLEVCGVESFSDLVCLASGRSHREGWPARLAPDVLLGLFGASELFRGAELEPGPLPARLVPASFPRAGYQVGRALSLAWAPRDRPFVLLRDPEDFAGHRLGYLFVLWMMSEPFDQKCLGLGRAVARERRRSAAQMLLGLLTLSSCRALLFESSVEHWAQSGELEELLGQTLGLKQGMPSLSALSFLNVRRDESTRLYALFDAALIYQEMVEEYDVDWWRSPRALQRLRAENSSHAQVKVSDARLNGGKELLLSALSDALS